MLLLITANVKAQWVTSPTTPPSSFTTDMVGIGTTGPVTDASLHVYGQMVALPCPGGGSTFTNANPELWLDRQICASCMLSCGAPASANIFQVSKTASSMGGGSTTTTLDVINDAGWMGILQPTPAAPLDVNGNAIIEKDLIVHRSVRVGDGSLLPTPDAQVHIFGTGSWTPCAGGGSTLSNDIPELWIDRMICTGCMVSCPPLPTANLLQVSKTMYGPGGTMPASILDVINPNGWLGILQANPAAALDVNGDGRINNTLYVGNIPNGQADPFVVTCSGTSSVLHKMPFPAAPAPASISLSGSTLTLNDNGALSSVVLPSSGGDDLGIHVASMDLNMSGNDINNAAAVNAASFKPTSGSGSLTGDVGGGLHANGSLGVNISSSGFMCTPLTSAAKFIVGGDSKFQGAIQVTNAACGNLITLNGGNISASGTGTFGGSVTALSFIPSDKRFKNNIAELNNVKDKLFELNPKSYNYINGCSDIFKFDDKLHFGFIAQEVQEIFPDLVRPVDDNGHIGLIYDEIIPLLLQALKEEDVIIKENTVKIAALENRIAQLESKMNTGALGNSDVLGDNGAIKSSLAQNVPNPFSKETVIGFNIVGGFSRAYIGIYDLNGREIQKVEIAQDSKQVTFSQGKLAPGMYVYSLLVDDLLIDAKKMVIF